MMTTMAPVDVKLDKLKGILEEMGTFLLAFSGGLDSSFLLVFSQKVVPGQFAALTADSPSLPRRELEEAKQFARRLGVKYSIIPTDELDAKSYADNDPNRCYFCKSYMCGSLRKEADKWDLQWICDGMIADDILDFRPGFKAAEEAGMRHPLAEAGLTKEEIRCAVKEMGYSFWDRAKTTCLASRFPYGTSISKDRLRMIEESEKLLYDLGFREFRVRYHGEVARLEIMPEQFSRVLDAKMREQIIEGIKACGFNYVALDMQGFRSGSMNEALSDDEMEKYT
jgi:pyridinium-3,5-biscarboxylic acid mononucleotide sulfurtransferase